MAAFIYIVESFKGFGRCKVYYDCEYSIDVAFPCRQQLYIRSRTWTWRAWCMDWNVCGLGCEVSVLCYKIYKWKMA